MHICEQKTSVNFSGEVDGRFLLLFMYVTFKPLIVAPAEYAEKIQEQVDKVEVEVKGTEQCNLL